MRRSIFEKLEFLPRTLLHYSRSIWLEEAPALPTIYTATALLKSTTTTARRTRSLDYCMQGSTTIMTYMTMTYLCTK